MVGNTYGNEKKQRKNRSVWKGRFLMRQVRSWVPQLGIKRNLNVILKQQITILLTFLILDFSFFYAVMNAWANVGSTLAAEQAEATLEALMQKAKAEKSHNRNSDNENSKLVQIRPDTIVFNSVIQFILNNPRVNSIWWAQLSILVYAIKSINF